MTHKGFTLIEILVTTAIVAIVFTLGTGIFSLMQKTTATASGTVALEQILGGAVRRARAGSQGTSWGVYLPYNEITRHTNTVTIFSGANYTTRDVSRDINYRFNEGVGFTTVDFSGAGGWLGNDHEIVFSALSGQTLQYGSITFDVYGDAFTITVTEDGFVVLE